VKEVGTERAEFVLSYKHPATGRVEELVLKVDSGTGFSKGIRLEDLDRNDPISVDYQENPEGVRRAVFVERVPTHVPVEKFSR
jgi:hypothetical protein